MAAHHTVVATSSTSMFFPHGELPHIGLVLKTMQEGGLEALDIENLRFHYAKTCATWSR